MDQLVNSIPTTPYVRNIMKKVARYHFVADKKFAYRDVANKLMDNQTISAPHMHARAMEYMEPVLKRKGKKLKILDVGSGSGYLTACYAEAVNVYNTDPRKRGTVYGLEYFQSLVNYSKNILKKNFSEFYTYPNHFKILKKDGKEGVSGHKFDGIHVGAACDFIPHKLLEQLNNNGIMLLPLKVNGTLFFTIVKKDNKGNISIILKERVRYVPLL